MGQRHQIYIVVKNLRTNKTETLGFHHQWLYGQTALLTLNRILTFVKASTKEDGYNHQIDCKASKCLKAAISIDVESGYYHEVHQLDTECQDPRFGDNNDGITIIDLRDYSNPSYCFMSVNGLEAGCDESIQELVPLSAKQYYRAYYDHDKDHTIDQEFKDLSNKVQDQLSVYPVTTLKTIQELFPAMYKDISSIDPAHRDDEYYYYDKASK